MNTKKLKNRTRFILLIGTVALLANGCNKNKKEEGEAAVEQATTAKPVAPKVDGLDNAENPQPNPEDSVQNLGWNMNFESPQQLADRFLVVMKRVKTIDDLAAILPPSVIAKLTSEQKQSLLNIMERAQGVKVELEQIGELDHGKRSRWAMHVPGAGTIVLDLKRQADRKWQIDRIQVNEKQTGPNIVGSGDGAEGKEGIVLPDADVDELNFTYTFLQHLLKQDFKQAKALTADGRVSDAQLAGLCILFEEADYHLRKDKPLRAIFSRDTAVGFYANVVSATNQPAGQFSVILQRAKKGDAWHVHELNLDSLLQDYAKRVAGGDVYFTPLVKNPKGGDTLAIYFDFASNELALRTKKQLAIVAGLLKVDASKTVNLTGHTDSVGGKDFNSKLSKIRALAVKDYLISQGVKAEQIVTKGFGFDRPRLPNTLDDGSDNPTGRRANRRTEIYLDF